MTGNDGGTGTAAASRPIFVLGVERSGTSLVAELVHCWGAHAGDLSLHAPANDANPRGFWEYLPMQELLVDIAAGTGVSEWDREFQGKIQQQASEPLYRQRALQLVAGMEAAGAPWVWKEPFLSLQMDFWEKIVGHPVCVATVRTPHDSARSFARTSLPEPMHRQVRLTSYFGLRWQRFMLSVLEYFERNPASLCVSYEDLLKSPVPQVHRLCAFLDRQFGRDEGFEDRFAAMLEAINPALWRNKSEISFFDLPEALEPQKDLLRHLRKRAADIREPFDPALFPLPPYAQEYLENFDLFMGFLVGFEDASERDSRRQRIKVAA
jgi:hypothetical protein